MRWLLISFYFLSSISLGFGFDPTTQDDSLALVRHFKKPEKPLPPFEDGKFEPRQGETITLMGGTEMYRMQEYGYLESVLHMEFPDKNLKVRNIAWPADTVYRQQRPMFFYTEKGDTKEGSIPDQREKIEPGIFILQFGKMESLDGMDALPKFVEFYNQLITELSIYSRRIVLMRPPPFMEDGVASDLAEQRNDVLAHYSAAIEKIAEEKGFIYVRSRTVGESLGTAHTNFPFTELPHSEHESMDATMWLMSDLRLSEKITRLHPRVPGQADRLIDRIKSKNKLWNQYYRPTNWAFLFGDRQHVPSSRDHRDANRRWFVEELEKLPQLIAEADQAIWEEAQKLNKKLTK